MCYIRKSYLVHKRSLDVLIDNLLGHVFQTQATLLQMSASKGNSKKLEDSQTEADKVKPAPAATPPASVENIENRK